MLKEKKRVPNSCNQLRNRSPDCRMQHLEKYSRKVIENEFSEQHFPLILRHRSEQFPKTHLMSYFSIMLLYLSASILATMIGGTPSASWGAALSNCSKNPDKGSEIGIGEIEHLELGKIPQQLQMIDLEIKKSDHNTVIDHKIPPSSKKSEHCKTLKV